MNKRWAVAAGVATVVATLGATVSPAGAIPDKGEGEPWVCPGGPTTIFTAGRNGWINGVHYQAVSFIVTGTFTPTGGAPEPFVESKTWGGGRSGPGAITCTQHVVETDAEGTVVYDARVTAVPVR
jgi:hypothetical protein